MSELCECLTSKKQPCKKKKVKGSDFCIYHQGCSPVDDRPSKQQVSEKKPLSKCEAKTALGIRCSRNAVDESGLCSQHKKTVKSPIPKTNEKKHAIWQIPEMFSSIISYSETREDLENLLVENRENIDPNKAMISLIKQGTFFLPIGVFNGKTFDHPEFDKTREFFLRFGYDILPKVAEYIKDPSNDTKPQGFIYIHSKPMYPGIKSAPYIKVLTGKDWEERSDNIPNPDILEKKIKETPLLRAVLERGDFVHSSFEGDYRDDGLYIWDGEKSQDLRAYPDDYGTVPPKYFQERPLGYYFGDPGLYHNTFTWVNLCPYVDEIIQNFKTNGEYIPDSSFIYHDVDGDKKIIIVDEETASRTPEEFGETVRKMLCPGWVSLEFGDGELTMMLWIAGRPGEFEDDYEEPY